MLTLSDCKTEYLDLTNDASAADATRSVRRIAQAERFILSLMDWNFLNKTFTLTSVASTQTYALPYALRKVEDGGVVVVASGTRYTPVEIADARTWNLLNATTTSNISDSTQYFHLDNGNISFYPTFSTSGNVITITGTRMRRRSMSLLDYTTGAIAVTNGSTTITGTTTAWSSSNVKPEAFMEIDGVAYEIASLTSATVLVLATPYQGVTATGLTYRVGDASLIPESFQDILWLRAGRDYFRRKENTEQKRSIIEDYSELLKAMENSTYAQSTRKIIPRGQRSIINPNDYPRNIG